MSTLAALNSSESATCKFSVIAHIDLDAFYAQVLQVYNHIDPQEPLGCRQWNSLIAVNYPARAFGIKRGTNIFEARKMCPKINLPGVATFKKGDTKWDFHREPDRDNYKVSLDIFRREGRKVVNIIKQKFSIVERIGTDECFIDLGPQVYAEYLKRYPDVDPQTTELNYDELIQIGSELVNDVRMQIKEKLQYTTSAGVSTNKIVAKLGSGYQKPFKQTVIPVGEVQSFLSNFKFTDMWGLGGNRGSHVVSELGIENETDQCEFVRNEYTKDELIQKFEENGMQIYQMARGEYKTRVDPKSIPNKISSIKDFRKLKAIANSEDLDLWLRTFAADLSTRIQDINLDLNITIVPQVIGIKHVHRSKQMPFRVGKDMVESIYQQSRSLAKQFVTFPLNYAAVEVSQFLEVKKSVFELAERPTKRSTIASEPNEPDLKLADEFGVVSHSCGICKKRVFEDEQTHADFHYAQRLQQKQTSKPQQKKIKHFFS